jgi:hypothetical protein
MKLLLRSLLVLAALTSTPLLIAQEAPKPDPPSRPQDDPPVWAGTFDEAVERARKLPGGRVLVEVREAACPDCERMEKLVYPTASFRAFPAWLVVSTDGLLCGKQEGASNQSTWVERFVATEREWAAFQQKLQKEKKAPNDLSAVLAVAEDAYRRFGDEMAGKRFRRIADDPKSSTALKEKALPYLASIGLAAGRLDDAERDLKALLVLTKDPALREKAELRLVDVEVGRGERRKAQEKLKGFLAKYPESPLRPQAEALLEALSAPNP